MMLRGPSPLPPSQLYGRWEGPNFRKEPQVIPEAPLMAVGLD